MTELERIINKYLSTESEAITYSDFNQDEVNKLFQNMGSYERPDILSMYDNKIIAIEHFEFDSYKNTRKGSDFKIQDNIIEQKMRKEINSNLKDKGEIMIHDQIENNSSLKQYYDNFRKVLLSHIDNIPEYKEHIINDFGDNKEIEFWFFVEDVSPLGSYYHKKTNIYPSLLLPFSKENIEILKQHKEIKELEEENYSLKEKLNYWKNKFIDLINLIKHRIFHHKHRDNYYELSKDLYSNQIISKEIFNDIKDNYDYSKEHDYGKDKDDFDISI